MKPRGGGERIPQTLDVLIVSFNTRDLLRDCLRSIALHAPVSPRIDVTISVLDNASGDGSAAMVAEEFPDVRLVRSDVNLGFGAGNNRLAATSQAEFLMPLNSDTVWRRDIATPLLEVLASDSSIAIVGPRLVWPDGRRQLSSQAFPTVSYEMALALRGTKLGRLPWGLWDAEKLVKTVRQEALDDQVARDTDFLWATCWLFRAREFPNGNIFDPAFPMYDEDLDVCLTLRDRGRRVVYVPTVELVHLGGASSTPESKKALMRRARVELHRRHGGRAAAAAYVVGTRTAAILKTLNNRRRLPVARL